MKLLIACTLTMTPCFVMIEGSGKRIAMYDITDSTRVEVWSKGDTVLRYKEFKTK